MTTVDLEYILLHFMVTLLSIMLRVRAKMIQSLFFCLFVFLFGHEEFVLSEVRKLSEITRIHPYNLPLTSNYSSFLYISTKFCSKIELFFLPDLYFKLNSKFNLFSIIFFWAHWFFFSFFRRRGWGNVYNHDCPLLLPPPPSPSNSWWPSLVWYSEEPYIK